MKRIDDKINRLNQLKKDWMSYDTLKEINDNTSPEFVNAFLEFANEINFIVREKNDYAIVEKLLQSIKNEKLRHDLNGFIWYTVKGFLAMSPFRKIEQKNRIVAENLMSEIFLKWVLFFDKEFPDCYVEYEVDTRDEMIEMLKTIDDLVSDCVGMHYSMETFQREIVKKTGISLESAHVLVELVSKNYIQLQNNVILDNMEKE